MAIIRLTCRDLTQVLHGLCRPPAVNQWSFEVVFDYGEHDLDAPTPRDPGVWSVRNDPFSSYRAGFEVRTYRHCRRVLMFHHFPEAVDPYGASVAGHDGLVRSTDFTYSKAEEGDPLFSFVNAVAQSGYKRQSAGGYLRKSLPPVEFAYSEAVTQNAVREVAQESLENLPSGLDGNAYQWVDLDGEGLSGILTEQADDWFYKRNLGPIHIVTDNGSEHIEPRSLLELIASNPASGLAGGQTQD